MSSPLLQIPKSVSLNPSFRRFVSRVNDSVQRTLASRRPWLELLDFDTFSRPLSVSDATSRVRKNVSYFRVNYPALLGGVLAFSLLSHPFSLISLLLLISAWLFLYFFKPPEQPLIIFTRTFSNHETLALLLLVTVVMLFFTSVGSLLISTTLLGGVIICIHGAFRDPVDLFIESQDDSASTGFFSIAAAAAVRDVAALV